jgi:hypothetical protein
VTEAVGLIQARGDFLLDGQGEIERERCDTVDE